MTRPRLVADIFPGAGGSQPRSLTTIGDTLFFTTWEVTSGRELWKSDGTTAGTVRVADISANQTSSYPEQLTGVGDTLFFTANGVGGRELWKSDGTNAGTVQVTDIIPGSASSNPRNLTAVNGSVFFTLDRSDRLSGKELWKSDGTAAGTALVAAIDLEFSFSIGDFTAAGNTLFFTANDGIAGYELWRSDGSAAGTTRISDINPGVGDARPRDLVALGNSLYFTATDGSGDRELWKLNDTSIGTLRVSDIKAGRFGSFPEQLTPVGDFLYFTADDGVSGREIWKTNGTATGTVRVADIGAGLISANPQDLVAAGNRLYFTASDPTRGRELWRSDGTAAGTLRITDINPGTGSSNPRYLTAVGNTLYFVANDGNSSYGLWKTDGTVEGTTRLADRFLGSYGFDRQNLTAVGNALLFTADNRINGRELWAVDNEAVPLPVITLTGPAAPVAEDAGTPLLYTFTRNGPTTAELTVNYRVAGTARLAANAGDPADIAFVGSLSNALNRTITFAAGSATATVQAQPIADARVEANETLTLQLTTGSGYSIGTPAAVIGTIVNDDIASSASYELRPGQSSLRLTGTNRINGNGNELGNIIVGNSNNNRIAGLGGKDTLTGGGGSSDRDAFIFIRLSDSLLLEPISGTGGYFDEITDYNNGDRIIAPFSVETRTLTTSTGVVNSIAPGSIAILLNAATFMANSVAAFTVEGRDGTLIAMNDGRPGFQPGTDAVFFLQSYSLSPQNQVEFV